MRRLTFLVVTVAALYSGYWFVGANTVETGANDAITQMRTDGWDVTHTGLNTAGFPNRFDTTITDPDITSPDGLTSWTAPFVQVFALSYRPNEIIAIFPETQTLRIGPETITLATTDLRASAATAASTSLPLRNITATSGPATLTSTAGWQTSLASAITALRSAGDDGLTYDAYLRLTEVTLPVNTNALTNGLLPNQITDLRFDTRVTTSKPIDKNAGEGAPLHITTATIRDIGLTWGESNATLTGDLTADASGTPNGTLTLAISNWQNLITAATNAGAIDAATAQTYTGLAQGMANGTDLTIPLTVTNGDIKWAFFTLGSFSLAP